MRDKATCTNNTEMTPEMQNAAIRKERAFLASLLEAAIAGKGETVKNLVQEYSDKHNVPPEEVLSQFKDGQGRTALHFACQSSSQESSSKEQEIVSLLLKWLPHDAAADILKIKDTEGLTPLMFAAQNPNGALAEQRVDTILTVGGNKLSLARSKAGATALHYAAAAKDTTPATILRLYDAGKVALESNTLQGGTPLHWAAALAPPTHNLPVLQTLVNDCRANLNAKNQQGMPPIIMAAAAANDVHCKYLVEAGADCTTELPGNVTLYHMAADLNLVGTLAALLEVNDDNVVKEYCQRKNANGETPLDLALQEGNVGCVMLLSGEQDEAAAQARIDETRASSTPKRTSPPPPAPAPALRTRTCH